MTNDLDRVKEERAFLHDISSPLMITMGMIDYVNSHLQKNELTSDDIEKYLTKLGKAKNALEKMAQLLKDRRSILIEKIPDQTES